MELEERFKPGGVVIEFPKGDQAERLRRQIYSGVKETSLLRLWCRIFSGWLVARGYLEDEGAAEWWRRFMMHQLLGSDVDLRTYLFVKAVERTSSGKSHVIRRSYVEITTAYDKVYSALSSHNSLVANLLFPELDKGNREKIGPKSVWRGYPQDGFDKCLRIVSLKASPQIDSTLLDELAHAIGSQVKPGSIKDRPFLDFIRPDYSDSQKYMNMQDVATPHYDTQSGPPLCSSGWWPRIGDPPKEKERLKRVGEFYLDRATRQFNELKAGNPVVWNAVMGIRTSPSHGLDPMNNAKAKRIICMVDKANAFCGGKYYSQMMVQKKTLRYGQAATLVHVAKFDICVLDMEMQRALNYCHAKGLIPLCGDYSSFDTTIDPTIQRAIWKYRDPWITGAGRFFSTYKESVLSSKLYTPTEVMYNTEASNGVMSGDYDTNDSDSDACLLGYESGVKLGLYQLDGFYVNGDDSVGFGKGLEPEVFERVSNMCGYIANQDKQFYKPDTITYLQRLHVRGHFGGVYSTYRALSGCLGLEHTPRYGRDNPDAPYLQAIEVISRLTNAAFHPGFEDLVEFIKSGDKYKLGADLSPEEVLKHASSEEWQYAIADHSTINSQVMSADQSSWAENPVNLVLRGKQLPPAGSVERFRLVYGQQRITDAEKVIGMSLNAIAQGKY